MFPVYLVKSREKSSDFGSFSPSFGGESLLCFSRDYVVIRLTTWAHSHSAGEFFHKVINFIHIFKFIDKKNVQVAFTVLFISCISCHCIPVLSPKFVCVYSLSVFLKVRLARNLSFPNIYFLK